jgi:hypothetical protein
VPQKHLTRFQLCAELLEQRIKPLLLAPPASRAQGALRFSYIEVGGGAAGRQLLLALAAACTSCCLH